MEAEHLLVHIIRPTLKGLGLWSFDAERLILGTACAESACGRWAKQIGGPGLGPYSNEPDTFNDTWENYLTYRPELAGKIKELSLNGGMVAEEMIGNWYFATAMCRVHYLRVKEKIPDSLPGQARYWKQYYNTIKGKGTIEHYQNAWSTHVGLMAWT